MATGKVRAVYRNKKGATFSAPVEKHGDAWIMQTSDGPAPITYNFQDDAAGPLTFVEYREEPDTRLHIDRLPGENSFGALKRAYAEKEIAYQRQQRQATLQTINNDSAAHELNRIAAARDVNAQFAQTRKPRGSGTSEAVDAPKLTDLTRAEIDAAFSKNRR